MSSWFTLRWVEALCKSNSGSLVTWNHPLAFKIQSLKNLGSEGTLCFHVTDCRICLFRRYDRIPGASKLRNRGFVLTGGPGTQASGPGRQSRKTLVTLHQYRKHRHSGNTGRRETQMNAVFSSLSLLFSVQTTVQGAAHFYSGPSLSVNLLYLVYAWRFVSMVI